ncbi:MULTISPECIES: hypothetical protein [unclassified Agrobacterium]|uniref:hypothetical protein n=1 Tax=unclassified Agrobacterium TaxID=2632611 RepID=UPI0003716CDC|nr:MULTISPECIES: hypothetical protein [unclassified Agrobacterium]SNB52568.1 hypothetical protein SAMN05661103_1230 [Agrobacterium sp. 719_389]
MFQALRIDGSLARRFMVVLLLSLFASPHSIVRAEDKAPDPSATMAEFVRDNPSCLDFTDGCSVCTVADGKIVCSAPRIQCQVRELTCTRQ